MVKVEGGDFDFKVEGIEIEGSDDVGVDVQYPWENSARRFHEHPMQMKLFYIDKYPVTNAEFKKFLSFIVMVASPTATINRELSN